MSLKFKFLEWIVVFKCVLKLRYRSLWPGFLSAQNRFIRAHQPSLTFWLVWFSRINSLQQRTSYCLLSAVNYTIFYFRSVLKSTHQSYSIVITPFVLFLPVLLRICCFEIQIPQSGYIFNIRCCLLAHYFFRSHLYTSVISINLLMNEHHTSWD